jgi:tRNA threonylcarbamoyladenosine biosynthesis protein TsaB
VIVLGIDTSTARSSVAVVAVDGRGADADPGADGGDTSDVTVLAAASHEDLRGHGSFLAPAIAACLAESGLGVAALDGVAVGTGPGLYTGLRIGMATATALAWARGIPVAGVGGLDAVVLAARRRPAHATVPLVAVLDARRGQWFHATARAAPFAPLVPAVGDAAAVAAALAAAGADARAVGEVPDGVGGGPAGPPLRPDAADVARLAVPALRAGGLEPAALTPVYLRDPDVRIGWAERGGGRAGGP